MSLKALLETALQRRLASIETWMAEGTDSYRVFHGAAEGRPGLSIDKYGSLLLAQVAGSSPLSHEEEAELRRFLAESASPNVVARRQGSKLTLLSESTEGVWSSTFWARELGLEFAIDLAKANRDPQLFLDFRAAKRALRETLAKIPAPFSVLNLFAYTCSVSCHCAAVGATEIWSADFSGGNLTWGQKNFRRNDLPTNQARFLTEDCIGLLWALTDNRKALSRQRGRGPKCDPRQFSVVVADPPAFSKGKFAAVDLVRDPETVFGPAWDVVAPGGLLVAANNSAKVTRAEFEQRLSRMFEKRAAPGEIAWVPPDPDFPSFDGEYPLKVAFCRKV